jgi:hypothetical protein
LEFPYHWSSICRFKPSFEEKLSVRSALLHLVGYGLRSNIAHIADIHQLATHNGG